MFCFEDVIKALEIRLSGWALIMITNILWEGSRGRFDHKRENTGKRLAGVGMPEGRCHSRGMQADSSS
jgi:hypothetical protein